MEDSVTQVIEQQLKGLDNLLYMQGTSNSSGASRISITFNAGTNIDVAQMQVQNKLPQAMSRLPQAVQNRGVTVTKGGNDFLMIVSVSSGDGSASAAEVGDYITSNLVDMVSRIDGVGEVQTLGTGFAMRIWLDPDKLRKYTLIPSDVNSALTAQNAQVSAGQLGALPAAANQQLNATITARSKLQTVEQFEAEVLVMYIFLQNFRATLIPAIAVPVVLLGTFGVLSVFGYSINTLTMFGMVLAIGLLVDDAIVVVENV